MPMLDVKFICDGTKFARKRGIGAAAMVPVCDKARSPARQSYSTRASLFGMPVHGVKFAELGCP